MLVAAGGAGREGRRPKYSGRGGFGDGERHRHDPLGCALCPRESLGLSLQSTSRLAASDPSPWPAPRGQHIKGANTSGFFFLLLTIITMAIPEESRVRGKLPSRSQGLLLLQKQGFLYFFGILKLKVAGGSGSREHIRLPGGVKASSHVPVHPASPPQADYKRTLSTGTTYQIFRGDLFATRALDKPLGTVAALHSPVSWLFSKQP